MPTCPGCERPVSYEELPPHVRACRWVWSERPAAESRGTERVALQVQYLAEQVTGSFRSERIGPLPRSERPSAERDWREEEG